MKVASPGLKHYASLINAGQPYSFIRYGNGEWDCIKRARPRTGSGSHSLTDARLRNGLIRSITECHQYPYYLPALRPSSLQSTPGIQVWLEANQPKWLRWHDCTVFYKANKHGALYPMIKAIRECPLPIYVIGPRHLRALNKRVFQYTGFIEVPHKDCFTQRKRILSDILRVKTPALFSFSCGPPAKLWIYELWRHIGKESYLIDFGSVWDVFCGVQSRSYHKRMTGTIIRKNLNGK